VRRLPAPAQATLVSWLFDALQIGTLLAPACHSDPDGRGATRAAHYGGQRPWFRCPGCQRRVAVLCGYDTLFLCRHCYQLPYTSQYETRLDRLYRKMRKLQDRRGGQYTRKPKGMYWRTWERLRDQALDAEMTRDLAMEATLDRLMRRG
jgi:hypothetical protein